MGLFDRFIVGDFRAPLPVFWLFVQIGCDTEGEHELTVEFRQIGGASVLRADLKHGIAGKSSITGLYLANVNLRLEHVTVPGAGSGDRVEARAGRDDRVLDVVTVIEKRVSAPLAAECVVDRTPARPEAAWVAPPLVRDRGAGRPTKRDRREIDRYRGR